MGVSFRMEQIFNWIILGCGMVMVILAIIPLFLQNKSRIYTWMSIGWGALGFSFLFDFFHLEILQGIFVFIGFIVEIVCLVMVIRLKKHSH